MQSTIAEGVGLYWRYEKQIRRDESAIASTLGATGAMYAMRRSLWRPLPEDTILDDVLAPMRWCWRAPAWCSTIGRAPSIAPRADATDREPPEACGRSRATTSCSGSNPRLLLPWRNPRVDPVRLAQGGAAAVPYALPPLWLLSFLLSRRSMVYAAAFAAQCLFYLLAQRTARGSRSTRTGTTRDPWARPPVRASRSGWRACALTVLVMNASAVAGLAALLTRQKVWR